MIDLQYTIDIQYTVYLLIGWMWVIILHESGHILAYKFYLKKVLPIKFKWWGILVGDGVYESPLRIKQKMIVLLCGILFGIFPVIIFDINYYLYILVCSLDIFIFLSLMYLLFTYGNLSLEEL